MEHFFAFIGNIKPFIKNELFQEMRKNRLHFN